MSATQFFFVNSFPPFHPPQQCRDLSGRRLKHIKDEKAIAEWIAKEPERKAAAEAKKKAKVILYESFHL